MHFLHNDLDFTVGYIQYDVTHFGIVLYILCINKHLYKEIEHKYTGTSNKKGTIKTDHYPIKNGEQKLGMLGSCLIFCYIIGIIN